MKETVFIGLGSNVGDREQMVFQAYALLSAMPALAPVALSPLYKSPALLPEGAPKAWDQPFINAVAQFRTSLGPEALMLLISQVERELGKRDRGHWAPREIDVDLLAVGGCEVTRPGLTLPHPAIRERDFVLLPWRDIAPDWPLAGCDGQTISALSARLTGVSAQPLAECAA